MRRGGCLVLVVGELKPEAERLFGGKGSERSLARKIRVARRGRVAHFPDHALTWRRLAEVEARHWWNGLRCSLSAVHEG